MTHIETIPPTLEKLIKRFAETACSWMCTVRPDGRAHSAPVWHTWYRGCVYVVAKPTSIKVKNLAQNPSTVLTLPDPSDVFILDGRGKVATQMRDAVQPLFLKKYAWDIATDADYSAVLEIRPTKLLVWGSSVTDGDNSAMRWTGDELRKVSL